MTADSTPSSLGNFDSLLRAQSLLMLMLGVVGETGQPEKDALRSAAIGLSCEAAEILDELNKANRPWKPRAVDPAHIKGELIDVLFYFLEIALLLGLDEKTILDEYRKKLAFNLARIVGVDTELEREAKVVEARKKQVPMNAYSILYEMGYIDGAESVDVMSENDLSFIVNPEIAVSRKNGWIAGLR